MLAKYSKNRSSYKKQFPTFIQGQCHQFSLKDLKKSTNNFDEDKKIGESKHNILYKGNLKKHNGEKDYPIALMRMKNVVEERRFKKEIELNWQLCHPNLTSFIGFCDQKDEKILVYRKDDIINGSLYDHLLSRDMELLSWKKRLEICIGAAKGLHYLHTGVKHTIYHRDITPHNILLDKSLVPKFSQFGYSLQEKLSRPKPKNPIKFVVDFGTEDSYTAPEFWETNIYTDKCDVYSFGVVLLEVACTTYKQTFLNKLRMFVEKINYARNYFEKFLDADHIIDPILMRSIAPQCFAVFKDIVIRCLKHDPNERPIMGEVEVDLEHALTLQE